MARPHWLGHESVELSSNETKRLAIVVVAVVVALLAVFVVVVSQFRAKHTRNNDKQTFPLPLSLCAISCANTNRALELWILSNGYCLQQFQLDQRALCVCVCMREMRESCFPLTWTLARPSCRLSGWLAARLNERAAPCKRTATSRGPYKCQPSHHEIQPA